MLCVLKLPTGSATVTATAPGGASTSFVVTVITGSASVPSVVAPF